jgi:3-hydroxyisobutyrate dehydrogenase
MAMDRSIAVVGLGAMGFPMSLRLLQAGFDVRGVDRDARTRKRFTDAGGTAALTMSEAVRDAQALLLLVVNAEQAEDVLFGTDGAARMMPPGGVVLLSLTASPQSAARIGARLAAHDLRMVDSPVSGGVKRAADGTLTILASGPPADVDAARRFLAPLGNVHEIGPLHGQASTVKLINQLLCGVHLVAAAEAVALAERAGVDLRVLHRVVTASSGTSHMFASRAPMMRGDDRQPTATIDILLKDLALVDALGTSVSARMPLARTALDLFGAASSQGAGAGNDYEIIRYFRPAQPQEPGA